MCIEKYDKNTHGGGLKKRHMFKNAYENGLKHQSEIVKDICTKGIEEEEETAAQNMFAGSLRKNQKYSTYLI
eukprot:UN01230